MTTEFWIPYCSFSCFSDCLCFCCIQMWELDVKVLHTSLERFAFSGYHHNAKWTNAVISLCMSTVPSLTGNAVKAKYCTLSSRAALSEPTAISMCVQLGLFNLWKYNFFCIISFRCLVVGGFLFGVLGFFFKENISGHMHLAFILNIFWFLSNFSLYLLCTSFQVSVSWR